MQKIKYIAIGIIIGLIVGGISVGLIVGFCLKKGLDEAQSIISATTDKLKSSEDTKKELTKQLEDIRNTIKSSNSAIGQFDNTINESQRINDEATNIIEKYIKP